MQNCSQCWHSLGIWWSEINFSVRHSSPWNSFQLFQVLYGWRVWKSSSCCNWFIPSKCLGIMPFDLQWTRAFIILSVLLQSCYVSQLNIRWWIWYSYCFRGCHSLKRIQNGRQAWRRCVTDFIMIWWLYRPATWLLILRCSSLCLLHALSLFFSWCELLWCVLYNFQLKMRAGGIEQNRGRYRKRSPKPKQRRYGKTQAQSSQSQSSPDMAQVWMFRLMCSKYVAAGKILYLNYLFRKCSLHLGIVDRHCWYWLLCLTCKRIHCLGYITII